MVTTEMGWGKMKVAIIERVDRSHSCVRVEKCKQSVDRSKGEGILCKCYQMMRSRFGSLGMNQIHSIYRLLEECGPIEYNGALALDVAVPCQAT